MMKFSSRKLLSAWTVLIASPALFGSATPGAAAVETAWTTGVDCTPTSEATSAHADAVASAAEIKVWLAGDSTMANPSSSTPCPVGWGSQFDPLFTDDVTVVNSAMGGRSVQTWLYDPNVSSTVGADGECVVNPKTYSQRWATMLDANTGMRAGHYLLIQFGINDGDRNCPRHVGSARYRELLTTMVKAAKARGVHPVLLTPVAAIRCSGGSAVGNRGFLTETTAVGTANQVPVIDLHKLSYTLYNSLRFCPNDGDYTKGAVGAFFCNDHTHFEKAGAQQIARVVTKALKDQRIGLSAYLK